MLLDSLVIWGCDKEIHTGVILPQAPGTEDERGDSPKGTEDLLRKEGRKDSTEARGVFPFDTAHISATMSCTHAPCMQGATEHL